MAHEEFKWNGIISKVPPEFDRRTKRQITIGYMIFPVFTVVVAIMAAIRYPNLLTFSIIAASVLFLVNSYLRTSILLTFLELDMNQLSEFASDKRINEVINFKREIHVFTDYSWGLFSVGIQHVFVKVDNKVFMNTGIDGIERSFGFLPLYLNILTKDQRFFRKLTNTTSNRRYGE